MSNHIYIGDQVFNNPAAEVSGEFCQFGGEEFYKLAHVDQMRPFFMSIVSSEDHWLFMSSNKGVTAGRINSDHTLFPYYTDDKLMASVENTGSKTILMVNENDRSVLWEPFSERYNGIYSIERNLYKNRTGSQVIFEEINNDLKISFLERWAFSNSFGLVRTSEIRNHSDKETSVQVLDGLQNLMPSGISELLQSIRSNLTDAYKKSELLDEFIGIYSLSARIVDRAIPSEALESTVVWSCGLEPEAILLSSIQVNDFRAGEKLHTENDVRAEKGAYLINTTLNIAPEDTEKWAIIAEVDQSITDVVSLKNRIKNSPDIFAEVEQDVSNNTRELLEKIARADGVQLTQDKLVTTRHLNNVMFNIMRGGIFMDNYRVEKADFTKYIVNANQWVADRVSDFLEALPDDCDINELRKLAAETGDVDLQRLTTEYMPLSFSRRHGDPSRPWNRFNIITKDDEGNDLKYYEGNWRDIFQNWEALAISFPEYIENMILKFLNASTIDGYNPYRISSNGIDWEIVEPEDPWSYIGYWGDHQIIYLLKLLELYERVEPGKLNELLSHNYGVYADVPYRIKPFSEILKNPQDTIDFDHKRQEKIEKRVEEIGFDGKLTLAQDGNLLRSTIIEKILISVLTKLSNFIPDGGIWMNTQRPEWNDANNALVGNGVSMVTLYQLRRYLLFLDKLLKSSDKTLFRVNEVIANFLVEVIGVFSRNQNLATSEASPEQRREFMQTMGLVGEVYRDKAYTAFKDSELVELPLEQLLNLVSRTVPVIDQTIKGNERADGLYHSYNILSFNEQTANIGRLDLMLEGQVNVLASGYLSKEQTIKLLKALEASDLYRQDQNSYVLYPDKQRALFVNRNNIPADAVSSLRLVALLKENGNTDIIQFDEDGGAHFNPDLHNADALGNALERLASRKEYKEVIKEDRQALLAIYESVFVHKEFTGRSGTFYGYEGLGSIYWHMVSKLVEAVGELVDESLDSGDSDYSRELAQHFHRLKDGIGVHKSPVDYGAIPTDPYSHTPGNKGVQQPGMTGQVKEDILSRFLELGVQYEDGKISFSRGFFDENEFLTTADEVDYLALTGDWQTAAVNKNAIFFTLCQVPVFYEKAGNEGLVIEYSDGNNEEIAGNSLPATISSEIFNRTGKIRRVTYRISG